MRPLAILLAAALLSGCSAIHNAQQAAAESYHQSFRTQFKASFMKSCTAQGATEKACSCVDATLESKHTDQELVALASNDEHANDILREAVKSCRR